MFITSAVPRLKRKFGPTFEGFDLLIEPASNASRAVIKSMEPPAHDGLNTSWIDDEAMRKKAETGMTQLRRRVTELLERHVKINVEGSEQHAVFDKFFSVSGAANKFQMRLTQLEDSYFPTDKSQRAFSRMPLHLLRIGRMSLKRQKSTTTNLTILEKMT